MTKKFSSLLFFAFLTTQIASWDQITTVPFQVIFPFISSNSVDDLTKLINKQNTTNQSIEVLDTWLKASWVTPPISTTPKPNTTSNYYGKLVDKEFARNLAVGFLEYREAFKKYVRFLFRSTQVLGYFNEKEATEMREEIYKRDRFCYNDIGCVESNTLVEMSIKYEKTKKTVKEDLKILMDLVHKFPGVGDKLKFSFKRD